MDEQNMKALADNLWLYFEPKIKDMMKNSVSYYRAKVVRNHTSTDGKIDVQKPFDDTIISLPCVSTAQNLSAGSECVVAVFGDYSNSVILGNGKVSGL